MHLCFSMTAFSVTKLLAHLWRLSQSLKVTRRVKEMCSVAPDINHTVLLVGGGEDLMDNTQESSHQMCFRIVSNGSMVKFFVCI